MLICYSIEYFVLYRTEDLFGSKYKRKNMKHI